MFGQPAADLNGRRLADMQAFLRSLVVLPYGERVATTWGQRQAGAQLRGRPLPANDSCVAACCLVRGLPLARINAKDYADFVAHDGLSVVAG